MGQPIFNPILDGFSRSIGNLTFYKRDGKTFTRRKSSPTGAPSKAQSAIRKSFIQSAKDWKLLPLIVKETWKASAPYRRGYNRFIGVNSIKYKEKEPISFSEQYGLEIQATCTATSGALGSIDLSYVIPSGFTGEITLFYRPVPINDEGYQRYISEHKAATASGTITLQGCIPGREYEIQVLLSDKELSQATLLSESIAMKATAGA